MDWLSSLLVGGLLAYLLGWWYNYVRLKFWSERGVATPKTYPFFGNAFRVFTLRESMGDAYTRLYRNYPLHDYVGFYQLTRPQLVVRSPHLIEKIMVKDFSYFMDHGLYLNEEKNWIDQSLFNLNGSRWRAVRNKMTPAFTSGKLKQMTDQMIHSADNMSQTLAQLENNGEDVDIKEVMSVFSMEVIASCAFGLEVKGWKGASKFRAMGAKILNMTKLRYLGAIVFFTLPDLAKLIDAKFTTDDVRDYFSDIITKTMQTRKDCPSTARNDFVQLLVQMKEKGRVELRTRDITEDDDYLNVQDIDDANSPINTETFELDERLMIAQAYSFLTAGFDATSVTLTFGCLELALHQDHQERLRTEVKRAIKENGGFTYKALQEMKFLDQCINETLRKYPLVTFLIRICTKKYTLVESHNNKTLELEPGTPVIIPIQGLHEDSLYYREAEKWDPDRWDADYCPPPQPYTFLPFGAGPRMCIGMRFAVLQMKLGLARLISDYVIELSPRTRLPIKMVSANIVMLPENTIWFKIKQVPRQYE